jgi:hypothetical protein
LSFVALGDDARVHLLAGWYFDRKLDEASGCQGLVVSSGAEGEVVCAIAKSLAFGKERTKRHVDMMTPSTGLVKNSEGWEEASCSGVKILIPS